MKHLKIETEDGAVIEYRYKDVEQLKGLLPRWKEIEIGCNVQLGDNIVLGEDVWMGDDCIIGNNVRIGRGVVVGNNAEIEAWCTVYPDVHINDNAHLPLGANVTGE